MNLLRKLTFALATTTLIFSVTVLIASLFITRTLASETTLKTALRDSGIYDVVATDITSKVSLNTDEISSSDPIVQKALNDSLNGITIRTFSEDFITSTFSWLKGEVKTPSFSLNVNDLRPVFISSLSAQLKAKLEALPACPTGVIPETTDPLTATCWPRGVSIDEQIKSLTTSLESESNEVFETKNISAQDVTVDVNGVKQPYYQAFNWLPKYYYWLTLAPWIAAISILILLELLVLLARPHEKGYKTAAIIFVPSGLFLVIAGSFIPQFSRIITNAQTEAIKDSTYREPLQTLVSDLINRSGSFFILRGALLFVVGILLIALYVLAAKQRRATTATGQHSRPY